MLLLLALMCAFAGVRACAAGGKTSLNRSSVVLTMDKTRTVRLRLYNAPGAVRWHSSKPSVASVDARGRVRARRKGTCVITARRKGKTYRCSVRVYRTYAQYCADRLTRKYRNEEKGSIVLAGSSGMTYWTDAAEAFAPYRILNVGISGVKTKDLLQMYKRLIVKYEPEAVVIFVGGNDITPKSDRISGRETGVMIRQLLGKLRKELPDTLIYYVSIQPSIQRWAVWDESQISNRIVKKYCARQKNMYYIDLTSYCLGKDGLPDKRIFRSDGLHFRRKSYREIWGKAVAARVKRRLTQM